MPIGTTLEKKLNKIYEPSTRVDEVFHGNEITLITNERGKAIHLYIGKTNENSSIEGEHYVRHIQREAGSERSSKAI